MLVSGTLTVSGDTDYSSISCRVSTWPFDSIDPETGAPDFSGGAEMIGVADIDCPEFDGDTVEYSVEIPTGDSGELAVVGRVETTTFINETLSSASPMTVVEGASSAGHDFVFTIADGPVGDTPPDAPPDDPIDPPPDDPPDDPVDPPPDDPPDDPVDPPPDDPPDDPVDPPPDDPPDDPVDPPPGDPPG
jgi:hypothetical protein